MRYPCPCCGYYTLAKEPPGTFAICPVCFREDDNSQFKDPTYPCGANAPSLEQARRNFRAFGAKTRQDRAAARPPRQDEMPPARDQATPNGGEVMGKDMQVIRRVGGQ